MNKIYLNNFYVRVEKLLILRQLKVIEPVLALKYTVPANTSETNFIMRIIKASDLVLECLETVISNFVSSIEISIFNITFIIHFYAG